MIFVDLVLCIIVVPILILRILCWPFVAAWEMFGLFLEETGKVKVEYELREKDR